MSATAPRAPSARWRKSKGVHWGRWELWRGGSWLAKIFECRLRSGSTVYVWQLINRDESGQADTLPDAKKAAKIAFEHVEIREQISELTAECEHSS